MGLRFRALLGRVGFMFQGLVLSGRGPTEANKRRTALVGFGFRVQGLGPFVTLLPPKSYAEGALAESFLLAFW